MNTREVDKIVAEIQKRFPTYGRGAMVGDHFAAGVNVRAVVKFVLSQDERRDDGDPE